MLVFESIVVVHVDGADAALKGGDGVGDSNGHVGVAQVKTDADIVQVAHIEDGEQVFRSSGIAGQVLDEQADTQGVREGSEVFECGEGVLDGARGPAVFFFAQVQDEVLKGDGLGGFQRALDLVHGVDAAEFVRMDDVDGGSTGAAHLAVGKERRVHRPGLKGIGTKPGGQLGDLLAAGVIEMLARGKDLDALCASTGRQFQQPRMQTLVEKQMRG